MKRSAPTFIVTLRPEPRIEPVRALRAALKTLLRRYGLKCLSIEVRKP